VLSAAVRVLVIERTDRALPSCAHDMRDLCYARLPPSSIRAFRAHYGSEYDYRCAEHEFILNGTDVFDGARQNASKDA